LIGRASLPPRAESGAALLAVLVIIVVIAGSSASFIWFMNQQQTRAGARLRSAAALAVAEAGVHRALSVLESVAPDGSPGRIWRPAAYSDVVPEGPFEGRFTLSLTGQDDGAIVITSVGEVAGTTRRLRARVYLASPALLAGLYGTSHIRLERPPAATVVLSYGAGIGDRPWVHIAAGMGVWFATTDVSINDPSVAFAAGPGPVDAPDGSGSATQPRRPGPIRLLLANGADLMLGQGSGFQRVDVQQLRAMGVYLDGVVVRAESLPRLPVVDGAYYQSLAAGNTGNAALNEAAGRYLGDADLARKRDSLYSREEFEEVRTYLHAGVQSSGFRGVVYVKGVASVLAGQRIKIADGALVAEGTVHLGEGAELEVTHSAATRTLPGIITLGEGALVISRDARLRAHGIVYASGTISVAQGARVDIVGALLGDDGALSFRSVGASVVIRYDPAVMGTPGLRAKDDTPPVAWVAAWEELP